MHKEPEEPQPKYHKGGFIPAGTGPVVNVRDTEYILTAAQWSRIRELYKEMDEE